MRETLPKGWSASELGCISKIIGGGTPKSSDDSNFCQPLNGIPWLSPVDLSGNKEKYIAHGRRNLSEKGYKSCSAKIIPKGSIVYSSRAPIGYVAIAKNPISTNQGFRSVVPFSPMNNEYLYYYLLASKSEAEKLASGSTFKEISGSKFKLLAILLPPLNEQKRIVAKLDAIIPRIDSLKARLDKIPALIKRFRQSVLTAAVTGKLTETWREEHPEVESAEGLLYHNIKTIEAKNYNIIWNDFEIPENWKCIYLKDIAELRLGKMLDSSKNKGDLLSYIRNVNVRWFSFDLSDLKEIRITKGPLKKQTMQKSLTETPLVGQQILYIDG